MSDHAAERADLLHSLTTQRTLFLGTVEGLTDEQARLTPTVSSLCLGGLVKHVAATERQWVGFVLDGPAAQPDVDWTAIDWSDPPQVVLDRQAEFRLLDHETLADVVADYAAAAAATDELLASTDLDARQPLPEAPWFEPGAQWSARRVVLHLVQEIAQHAGHADILRESIDGRLSMG
jgi:hypothetical protein